MHVPYVLIILSLKIQLYSDALIAALKLLVTQIKNPDRRKDRRVKLGSSVTQKYSVIDLQLDQVVDAFMSQKLDVGFGPFSLHLLDIA